MTGEEQFITAIIKKAIEDNFPHFHYQAAGSASTQDQLTGGKVTFLWLRHQKSGAVRSLHPSIHAGLCNTCD